MGLETITALPKLKQWKHITLLWRYNGRDGVSNHQSQDCLLNRRFRHRSQKHQPVTVNSLHIWPVTRKRFPFDGVIMSLMRCTLVPMSHRGFVFVQSLLLVYYPITHASFMSCQYRHPQAHSTSNLNWFLVDSKVWNETCCWYKVCITNWRLGRPNSQKQAVIIPIP